jgi:hypothetical protein
MFPCKGAIAFCSVGRLGLITSDEPEVFTFFDGTTDKVWKGIQLTEGMGGKNKDYPQKPGDLWCSRNPIVVGHIKDFQKP